MAYTTVEARGQLLGDLGEATEALALALACIGAAYEEVDEHSGDLIEEQLFRPVEGAYGRARRTYDEFARRHEVPVRPFEQRSAGVHSGDPRVYLERAIAALEQADHGIAELQDSMLPVEVGDRELRTGLSEVREAIANAPGRAHELLRVLGR